MGYGGRSLAGLKHEVVDLGIVGSNPIVRPEPRIVLSRRYTNMSTSEQRESRVLLIEDDKFMSGLLTQSLERAGFESSVAKTGSEGVEMFHGTRFDLIVLDLMLPDEDGLEVLRKIRRLPGGAEVKVLVLTNRAQEARSEEAKRLGVAEYLIKANFSLDEIIGKIKTALRV